jgi:hypothetical protein
MKKVILILTMLAITAQAEVGRFGGSASLADPEQAFIIVKNAETSTVPFGTVMKPSASADDGVTALIATSGTRAICVMAQSCAASKFCKCQVYGYISGILASGVTSAISAGQVLSVDAIAGKVSSLSTGHQIGIALDASTATEAIEGFIQLR